MRGGSTQRSAQVTSIVGHLAAPPASASSTRPNATTLKRIPALLVSSPVSTGCPGRGEWKGGRRKRCCSGDVKIRYTCTGGPEQVLTGASSPVASSSPSYLMPLRCSRRQGATRVSLPKSRRGRGCGQGATATLVIALGLARFPHQNLNTLARLSRPDPHPTPPPCPAKGVAASGRWPQPMLRLDHLRIAATVPEHANEAA